MDHDRPDRRGDPAGRRRIGLGAMDLTEEPRDDACAVAVLRRAVDLGADLVDTADRYAGGDNEAMIGRELATRRDEFTLCTKVGFVGKPGGERPVDNRPDHLRRSCEASLRRLRTDHVDLLLLHRVDPQVPLEDSIGTLADLQAEGKTRGIGMSEVGPRTLRTAHAIHPIDAVQIEYSLASRQPGDDLLDVCRELEVDLQAYSPLGIGLLGKSPEELRSNGTPLHRRLRSSPRSAPEAMEANAQRVRRLGEIAADVGCTVPQLALAWLTQRSEHVVAIPGTRDVGHLEANLTARNVELEPAVAALIDDEFPDGAFVGDRKSARQLRLVRP